MWCILVAVAMRCVGMLSAITDETRTVQLNGIEGVIAAYGDFNADKFTDVFVIVGDWTALNIYTWNSQNQKFVKSNAEVKIDSSEKIVSVSPADFNDDGSMDVLVSIKQTDYISSQVYLGDKVILKKSDDLKAQMKDQPSIIDMNGDYLPDLFGTNLDGYRTYWINVPTTDDGRFNHFITNGSNAVSEIVIPNSNGFVDATGDMFPDLVVKSKGGPKDSIMFEIWVQKNTNMTLHGTFLFKGQAAMIGQCSFADIDSDGDIDLIVPVCVTKDCKNSKIYSMDMTQATVADSWVLLSSNEGKNWRFDEATFLSGRMPTTIVFGDFIMNGKTDAVTILLKKDDDKSFAAMLRNEACSDKKQCNGTRALVISDLYPSIANPVSVSLLDVYENGALDFLVSYKKKNGRYAVAVLKNDFNIDMAFLKVAVLTGGKAVAKYGSNLQGTTALIQTTNTDGVALVQKAVQWSQSAYFALQTPYVVFGLGRSPNFVQKITIGVCRSINTKVNRVKSWTSIIPNAQVIVLPVPPDDPADWVTKLLVTPSKLLLQTAGVLLGTCLFISGLILILHIKEKREDEREKRKEAHKFHFDAL